MSGSCLASAVVTGRPIEGVSITERIINPGDIHARAAMLIGSVIFPLGWMWDLGHFLEASDLSFDPVVTHRFSLDDAQAVLQLANEEALREGHLPAAH